MWDFFETVRHRHSTRKYRTDLEIEPEKLHAILEMACAAPSAGDLQSYRILSIKDTTKRDAMALIADHQEFIKEAPAALVFCADRNRCRDKYGERGAELYAVQDATIAASYAQLASVAAGLSTAWVGFFDEKALSELLNLEPGVDPVAIITLGYPAEVPEQTPRRPLTEVVEEV